MSPDWAFDAGKSEKILSIQKQLLAKINKKDAINCKNNSLLIPLKQVFAICELNVLSTSKKDWIGGVMKTKNNVWKNQ